MGKFDSVLAVIGVLIVVHLYGAYSDAVYIEGNVANVKTEQQAELERQQEEEEKAERKNDLANKWQATKDNWTSDSKPSKGLQLTDREKREMAEKEDKRVQEQENEPSQDTEILDRNRKISFNLLDELTAMMADDPYNSGRFIDVSADTESHVVRVVVDTNTFSSLNLDLKASVYKAVAQDVRQRYHELLGERPDAMSVVLEDSSRTELATYKPDVIGDNYVLEMNHKNENNFTEY